MRTVDITALLGENMNAGYEDRYVVKVEAWVFDRKTGTDNTEVAFRAECTTTGESFVKSREGAFLKPHTLELFGSIACGVRRLSAELVELHAAAETEEKHLRLGGSVLEHSEFR